MKNILFALFFLPLFAVAQTETADQSLSPYFMVQGSAPGLDAMPLKSTRAEVNIAGVIAEVLVTRPMSIPAKKRLKPFTFSRDPPALRSMA